jgi:hypothetical protein
MRERGEEVIKNSAPSPRFTLIALCALLAILAQRDPPTN